MAIAPALPFGGLAGFRFLERTYPRQREVFLSSPDVAREITYFLEKAGEIRSVDQLIGDRRLLGVVLGAYGLDEDIDKNAFIRKVLEEGTLDARAFANRLIEPAYREMSRDLGFGDLGGLLILGATRRAIVERYETRQFELAVGAVDVDMRLAMTFKREAPRRAADAPSDDAAWLRLLGLQPMRRVVETAFNLPDAFAAIGLDQQVGEVKNRAETFFGTSSREILRDPAVLDEVVQRFLLNSQIRNGALGASAPGSVALSLLQGSSIGQGAAQNLFSSAFLPA